MVSPPVVVDSLLHVAILWGVLMTFFRFVGSRDATDAFTGGVRGLIHADFGSSPPLKRVMSTPVARRAVGSSSYRALRALYSRPDPGVQANNTWLFRTGFLVLAAMVAVIAGVVWGEHAAGGSVGFGHILRHNLLVFGMVGVVEYLFITRVVMRVNPAPPSVMVGAAVGAAQSAV